MVLFQELFREYKIDVYHSLNCDNIMFEGQVRAAKRLNTLHDDVERHYYVTANLTGAMARRYVCKGCNKACTSDATQSATRRVATAQPALRAHSQALESHALNVGDL